MTFKNYILIFISLSFLSLNIPVFGYLSNWTRNDPFPLFTSLYPYSFLTSKQKAHLMDFDYTYPVSRFRFSATGFRQSANYGRNKDRNATYLSNIPNGRWNMLGLFYDPVLRDKLFDILGFSFDIDGTPMSSCTGDSVYTDERCFCLIVDPRKSGPKKEFGFFEIPSLYRKYGVRFESELLLINKCFYAVGFRAQFGVANVRQTVLDYCDLTYQALGKAAPAYNGDPITNSCALPTEATPVGVAPQPVAPEGVTPPYLDGPVPPCPGTCTANNYAIFTGANPLIPKNCLPLCQCFQPCCDSTLCLSFPPGCKQIVIEQIMKQKDKILGYLGLSPKSFNQSGVEDLRLNVFWRQIFVINEEIENYPRLLFTPFAEAGVGIPMYKNQNTRKIFALPFGNNGHVSAGMTFGFNLDFLDTISFSFQAGFTKFFSREYCNFRLPTQVKESGIYPYAADVKLTPGTNWDVGIGFDAYHFIDNLSVWAEYLIVSHGEDDIKVCRSFIPTTSIYYKQGFLVNKYGKQSKWESHLFNIGFNYDLSPHLSAGVLWQAPVRQRNAFRSSTVLGTISFVY